MVAVILNNIVESRHTAFAENLSGGVGGEC